MTCGINCCGKENKMKRELFMTTDNYGIFDTGMTMEEEFAAIKALGFDGVEHHHPANREVLEMLKKYDLKMIHSEIPYGMPEGPKDDIDILHEIGVRYVCARVNVRTHEEALREAERINNIGREASKEGFKVFFHNMAAEFIFDKGEYLIETLLKNTDPYYVCSQLDLGWVVCSGADPVPFLKKYPGRVELMHVKPCTKIYGMKAVFPRPDPNAPKGQGISPEAREAYAKLFSAMQGPYSELARDYEEPMKVAESLGCRVFIYEREQFYSDDHDACMRDDIVNIRKFW